MNPAHRFFDGELLAVLRQQLMGKSIDTTLRYDSHQENP